MIDIWYWLGFGALVTVVMALDLGVFHRESRETTTREAAVWTAVWCLLALGFNGWVWWHFGGQAGAEFLACYLMEWSLSMDNVFVFAVIFNFFRVPMKFQHRVLFWGIIGAVVMRLAFILLGQVLIEQFHWILYVLGAFLVYTGVKLAFHDDEVDPEQSLVLRLARQWFPVSTGETGNRFVVIEAGRRCVTPLFLVLLVVETTDVAFAIDSVPAALGQVDKDAPYFAFVVFTSNIFAILGLRSLYFLLAGSMGMFQYLKYGLSAILVFVGIKMLLPVCAPLWQSQGVGWDAKISPFVSLGVIIGLLAVSVAASLLAPNPQGESDQKA